MAGHVVPSAPRTTAHIALVKLACLRSTDRLPRNSGGTRLTHTASAYRKRNDLRLTRKSLLGYVCIYGAQGTSEPVRLVDNVRIRDQGDGENSGVGQRVEGDADVAWAHRGGHNG
jgi:hypothetical protein